MSYYSNITGMKKKNILSLIVLITMICGFSSCTDKPLDAAVDSEFVLCSSSGWFDEYTDINGFFCTQRLIFYPNGRGEETIIRHFSNYPGDFEELKSSFYWEWDDDYYESIYIEYANGDYILFDELHIYFDEISGYFGDDYVTFEPFFH